MSALNDLMTVQEVADHLRVTTKTVYRLLDRGKIPATRVGHLWRFDRSSIDGWLRQNSKGVSARILVIDDDKDVCALFKETLEEVGHAVTSANESGKGLESVRAQDYDLVFLDLKMPGMDGAELFRQIRLIKLELPVIIITGYPESDLMVSALTIGPFGVMNKPFTGADILTAVGNYVRFAMPGK